MGEAEGAGQGAAFFPQAPPRWASSFPPECSFLPPQLFPWPSSSSFSSLSLISSSIFTLSFLFLFFLPLSPPLHLSFVWSFHVCVDYGHGLWLTWVRIPAVPHSGCVMLGELLHLSVLWFPKL